MKRLTPGYGLMGLRARLLLLGGTITAGPAAASGSSPRRCPSDRHQRYPRTQ